MKHSPVRPLAAATVLLALAGTPAQAGSAPLDTDPSSYVTYAEVVQVSPRYGWREVAEPVRQCVEVAPSSGVRYGSAGYYDGRGYDRRYEQRYEPRYERGGYHRDRHHRHDAGDTAAGLVGGLIGGLVGNQFGGGNGKKALTVAGALVGASIAGNHSRRAREPDYRYDYAPSRVSTVRRCTETMETRRVRDVDGYDVTYRYQGQTFQKWVDEHPGDRVRIQVAVEPADQISQL